MKLCNWVRRLDKTLCELDMDRLARLGYLEAVFEILETLTKDLFIDAYFNENNMR